MIGTDELIKAQKRFSYYPDDIWLYMLASQWAKIAEEGVFVSRCGDVKDEIGSRILAAKMVKEAIKLCFIIERQYIPYNKWLGTAFKKLPPAQKLIPKMESVLLQNSWKEREALLLDIFKDIADFFNSKKIISPIKPVISSFHDRPYHILNTEDYIEALRESIKDKEVKELTANIGSVGQFVDSTNILEYPEKTKKLSNVY